MTDVQALMVRGASGPVRHAVPPPNREVEPDAILLATPSEVPTSPGMLDGAEASIVASFGDVEWQPVSRGFSIEGYGGPEMVRYLMGDWRYILASHDLSAAVRERLAAGEPIDRAVASAADEIAKRIVAHVEADGVDGYMTHNSRATQIGIRDKSSRLRRWRRGPTIASTSLPTPRTRPFRTRGAATWERSTNGSSPGTTR